jgi:hypothetical protein
MIELQFSPAEIKALRRAVTLILSGEHDLTARQAAALQRANSKLIRARNPEAEIRRLDLASIRRCLPCRTCGVKPVWGAAFLVCPSCKQESDLNQPSGYAVRSWNRQQKLLGQSGTQD